QREPFLQTRTPALEVRVETIDEGLAPRLDALEYMTATSEAWELSSLAHKVDNIHEHLKELLILCMKNIDNLKILKALFCAKDASHPLLDGSSKTRVNVDVLRKKTVLLLISDLDVSHEEILVLTQIYKDSRIQQGVHYEIV
ncbi:hypothetical protein M8C21_007647, partial [Ambrosia artemisiifolia]